MHNNFLVIQVHKCKLLVFKDINNFVNIFLFGQNSTIFACSLHSISIETFSFQRKLQLKVQIQLAYSKVLRHSGIMLLLLGVLGCKNI